MRKKTEPFNLMAELDRATKSLGTVVDERWYIIEYRKPYYDSGYYGQGHVGASEHRVVSGYFGTREEAEALLAKSEPDDDSHALMIGHQKCYERLERRWL